MSRTSFKLTIEQNVWDQLNEHLSSADGKIWDISLTIHVPSALLFFQIEKISVNIIRWFDFGKDGMQSICVWNSVLFFEQISKKTVDLFRAKFHRNETNLNKSYLLPIALSKIIDSKLIIVLARGSWLFNGQIFLEIP